MSTTPPADEQDMLAAQYALRLLDGSELVQAQRLESSEPAFAAEVAAWQEQMAPLFGEVEAKEPDPAVWGRIRATIRPANDNTILQRKLRLWRGYGIAASALAASLALVVGLDRGREQLPAQTAQPPRPSVLVATLASQSAATSVAVAYDQERSSILVSPGQLRDAPGRDHELWIIPAGGQPISLGLVRGGEPQRLAVRRELAPHFQRRAALALSVEPAGGSTTGGPTGPVVATGELLDV